MSAILDRFLDPARLADMLANDEAMGTAPVKLSPFLIRIGPRGAPRVEFGAMAVSAASAFMQHFDLCEVNERCEVLAVRP